MQIIIKDTKSEQFKTFLKQTFPTMKEFNSAVQRIAQTVSDSIRQDQSSYIVLPSVVLNQGKEIERRVEICYDYVMIMVGDLHWSLKRALDHLPAALRCELDGKKWEPPGTHRGTWSRSITSEHGRK